MSLSKYPIALTIAGSDSGGGAGIQADLKAFSALDVYGASVITALTAQNTLGVSGIFPVSPAFVAQQLDSVLSDLNVAVVKTGMLNDSDVIRVIVNKLDAFPALSLVVDPVMIATSGDALLAEEALQALKTELIPRATVITPNLHEACALLDCPTPETIEQMTEYGEALLAFGCQAALVKGGHFAMSASSSIDVLVYRDGDRVLKTVFEGERFETKNTHGTGCTLASAIAAHLAKGMNLPAAVEQAKIYITAAIAAADELNVGTGHGPVNHFYKYWS